MTDTNLFFADIETTARALRSGQVSALALTEQLLERIEVHEPQLNAFITVTADVARNAARAADTAFAAGRDYGLLQGIPVAVKDLFDMAGVRNTFGTLLYENYVSAVDSTVVAKLREAGAVIVGKTNLHEFATGTTSVNPHYGAVRNPWDLDCFAGGSSGGSAAAVAAGLSYGAVGSDTGCSIRQPAHMCGLVGLKPTFGRISKFGAHPCAWSMDHAGPLTRTVRDCALMTAAMAGFDQRDPGCVDRPVDDYLTGLAPRLDGRRVGVPRDYFLDNCSTAVAQGFEAALEVLQSIGVIIRDVRLPDMNAARAAGHTIIFTEFHAAFQGHARRTPEKFSEVNRAFVELGGLYSARQVVQAHRVRRLITEQTLSAMSEVDFLVMPTCPITTAAIDRLSGSEPILHTQNTVPFDTISFPAVSVPMGFDGEGHPFGLQVVAKPFDEAGVLAVAYGYEQQTRFFEQYPETFA